MNMKKIVRIEPQKRMDQSVEIIKNIDLKTKQVRTEIIDHNKPKFIDKPTDMKNGIMFDVPIEYRNQRGKFIKMPESTNEIRSNLYDVLSDVTYDLIERNMNIGSYNSINSMIDIVIGGISSIIENSVIWYRHQVLKEFGLENDDCLDFLKYSDKYLYFVRCMKYELFDDFSDYENSTLKNSFSVDNIVIIADRVCNITTHSIGTVVYNETLNLFASGMFDSSESLNKTAKVVNNLFCNLMSSICLQMSNHINELVCAIIDNINMNNAIDSMHK